MLWLVLTVNNFKHCKWINGPIWSIDEILTNITTADQSGHESNGNERLLHITFSSTAGISPSDAVPCHILDICWAVLPLCSSTVSVFCSPNQLGYFLKSYAHVNAIFTMLHHVLHWMYIVIIETESVSTNSVDILYTFSLFTSHSLYLWLHESQFVYCLPYKMTLCQIWPCGRLDKFLISIVIHHLKKCLII